MRAESCTLAELAELVGGELIGDGDVRITGLCGLDDASPGDLVRVESERYLEPAFASPAAALLVGPGTTLDGRPGIRVARVKLAWARLLDRFDPVEAPAPGIHPTAVLGEGCEIGEGCSIGPYAVLGKRVRLGAGTVVHPHAVLGDDVVAGTGCELFPHSVLYPRTLLGNRVRVHAGAVIGADGFGYEWSGQGHEKIPQIGRVRIGDDVEIGANSTIDRATTGETVIGPGNKFDNLVQIGHNVRTGAHCIIVSQAGVAGSSTLGNGVVLAGQVGVKDHVTVGDGVVAAGKTGIWSDVPAGAHIFGSPPHPHREELRIQAAINRLPDLLQRVRALEKLLGEKSESE